MQFGGASLRKLHADRRGGFSWLPDFLMFVFFFSLLCLLLLVSFSMFIHGDAELSAYNDARQLALADASNTALTCPGNTTLLSHVTCTETQTTLSEADQTVVVHLAVVKGITFTFGLIPSYVQAEAVVPSDKVAAL